MKLISDHLSLKGKKETITITQFRILPGEVIAQVILGKEFDITKNGKLVATISPPEMNALELGKAVRQLKLDK
jgi:antitoxin (DNA-binding transcriptional repressor) of toxin-antitoxin stability system